MRLQRTHHRRFQTGISLIEIIIATSALALIVTVGIGAFGGVTDSARTNKLKTDVANLNKAIKIYEANGGSFGESNNPQAIIDQLKTRVSVSQRSRVVGLREMMVDFRLVAVVQSAEEAQSDEPRAVWDSQKHRFVIANEGGAGIKALDFDERLAEQATTEEDRDLVLEYADNSTWVWNYTDQNIDPVSAPPDFASLNSPGHPGLPNGVNARQLNTPEFSIAGGNYPLADFALAVTLTDPNLPGTSELMYSVAGGEWKVYEGEELAVSPGESIVAMGVTLDPDGWTDSEADSSDYTTTPERLELGFAVPKLAVTYEEVGGAMIPGTTPGSGELAPGSVSLLNTEEIPAIYQNSSVFTVGWTYDGSDPLSSATRIPGDPFSGSFPGEDIDYLINRWGTGTTLPIRIAAKSLNSVLVSDSTVVEKTLSAHPTQLRPPVVSLDSDKYYGDQSIALALDTSYGDTPVGARIYYTVDGSDPTPDNGTLFGVSSAVAIATADLPAQKGAIWALDQNNDKIVALGDVDGAANTTTDCGSIEYAPAAGGDPIGFAGGVGGAVIDQNNEIWFVVNKPIAGYGSRPLFHLNLNFIEPGVNPVAVFVRDLALETLSGQPLAPSDKITDLAFDRTTGKFTANWNTQLGENQLVNFTAYGSTLTPKGKIASGSFSPKIKYDINGDFFVKESPSKIDWVQPATADREYTFTKSLDGSYYVTDSAEAVVMIDSVTSLEWAKLETSDTSLSLRSTDVTLEKDVALAPLSLDGGLLALDDGKTEPIPTTKTVVLAEPTTTTTSTYTASGGETVSYTTTKTNDADLLFVGAVDTNSIGLSDAPNVKKGKKPMKGKQVELRAAVYGPEGYEQWFLPSEVAVETYTLFSNNGHGNNADGVDVSNPGQGGGGPNGEIDPSGGVDDEL